jgi:uncharacterized protein GlcG (DUF336 family)
MIYPSRGSCKAWVRLCATTLIAAAATNVSTQSRIEDFVVSGEAAKRILAKNEISLATAKRIVEACEQYSRDREFASAIVVLGPAGDIVHASKMDGNRPNNLEAAIFKAKTALYMREGSGAVSGRITSMEERLMRSARQPVWFRPGGLLIIVEDQHIGAIGVAGGRADELCAHDAVTKVVGPQPPLP